MIRKHQLSIAAVLLLAVLFCQSCRQGCTDSKAFNYSADARQNDGTCLYCDSGLVAYVTSASTFFDNTQGSPHFGENVLFVKSTQNAPANSGNGCKVLGRSTSTDSCGAYTYRCLLTNRTTSVMTMGGNLELFTSFGSFTHLITTLTIGPGQSVTIDMGQQSACRVGFLQSQLAGATFAYH